MGWAVQGLQSFTGGTASVTLIAENSGWKIIIFILNTYYYYLKIQQLGMMI